MRDKEKENNINNFIGTMKNILPILLSCNEDSELDFMDELSSWSKAQHDWYKWFVHDYGLDAYSLGENNSKFMIYDLISNMINIGILTDETDKDYLNYILNGIEENIEQVPYLNKKRKGGYHNNITDFKVSMVQYSYEFKNILISMGVTNDIELEHYMEIFHETVISLAQDMAFNWNEKTSIKERSLIFIDILPFCVNLVKKEWLNIASEQWEKDKNPLTISSIWLFLDDFLDTINNLDMGYLENSHRSIYWLQEDIGQFLIEFSKQSFDDNWSRDMQNRARWEFLVYIEPYLIDAWDSVANKSLKRLQDNWQNMDEDEQAIWINSDEAKTPMPLELFYAELKDILVLPMNLLSHDFDKEKLLHKCKNELSNLWGATDAICKIRE